MRQTMKLSASGYNLVRSMSRQIVNLTISTIGAFYPTPVYPNAAVKQACLQPPLNRMALV
jgi:hypothetical protein